MAETHHAPSSCAEARLIGAKHYWTGLPCPHGHTAARYTVDQSCVECKRLIILSRKAKAAADPEFAARMREWSRKSKAKTRATPAGKRAQYLANRRYVDANRDTVNAYYRGRRRSNADFKMASWCRSVLHKGLVRANKRKDATCTELLGYSGPQLREHIERQFTRGMTWERFGRDIHIDHIIPVAEFIRRGETRPSVIHALSNLRPMWAKDNIRKSDAVLTLL